MKKDLWATTKCPTCKSIVSKATSNCQICGAPLKQGLGNLGCLIPIILVGVFAYLVHTGKLRLPAQFAPSSKTMSVEVWWDKGQIMLKNTGTERIAGRTITIYINGAPPSGYKLDCGGPNIGELSRFSLGTFVRPDGTRFDPPRQTVTEAWVGGQGYEFKRFGN